MTCAPDLLVRGTHRSTEHGADDGVRTRDLLLGKQMLYQLSYVRERGSLYPVPAGTGAGGPDRSARRIVRTHLSHFAR